MTTEQSTQPANRVIIVGMLDTMLVREQSARRSEGRKMVAVTRRSGRERGDGGRWERLTLQVRSPYGGMFAMPLEIEPDVPGAELIAGAQPDTLLAVEGSLQLRQTFDGRLARDGQDERGRLDRGRPVRALQVLVTTVRAPSEEERRATSAVWLEGVIAEPPQVSRHPELPSVQLAGTILTVMGARPADFPGLVSTVDECAAVNVAIPTAHAHAERLYRPGNVVRIAGQLDCRMERQGGASVTSRLAEIDAAWAETRTALVDKPGELRQAERAYRRERLRFEEAPRIYVLAGYAELIAGETLTLDETFELRREYVREQRRQREARWQARAADVQRRATEQQERAVRCATEIETIATPIGGELMRNVDDSGVGVPVHQRRGRRSVQEVDANSLQPEDGAVLIAGSQGADGACSDEIA